ncbi:MAG: ribbon-helix-helix domain-containing protein [Parvularculaceae bacterium]|nr:ribbon-helix-helix domain-containing protein [Parvularculaceae bacterium]
MRKRSFSIKGHRTSVALEHEFWTALEIVAERNNESLAALVSKVDGARSVDGGRGGLASALRVFALQEFRR